MKNYLIIYNSVNESGKTFEAEYWLNAGSVSEARTIFNHEAKQGNLDYPNNGIVSIVERT